MKTFSFQAANQQEIDKFKNECATAGIKVDLTEFPDNQVELVADKDLTMMQMVARIAAPNQLLQTLRECPLKDNSLERDHNLW